MIKIDKIIYSKRKTLCIEINKSGKLIIRSPKFLNVKNIEKFLVQKENWIKEKQKLKNEQIIKSKKFLSKNKDINKKQAHEIINKKLKKLSSVFGLQYNRIKIGCAKTRWASCNYKNTICFTKKVAIVPDRVMNYIIIHELAHTKEKNHSKKFWQIVAEIIPDYKTRIKWLKQHQNILSGDL